MIWHWIARIPHAQVRDMSDGHSEFGGYPAHACPIWRHISTLIDPRFDISKIDYDTDAEGVKQTAEELSAPPFAMVQRQEVCFV